MSKLLLLLVLCTCLIRTTTSSSSCKVNDWGKFIEYQRKFHRVYDSVTEKQYRYHVFCENLRIIEQFPNVLHMTKYMDQTNDEFARAKLMPKRKYIPEDHKLIKDIPTTKASLPTSFDWAKHSPPVVTAVKDQGTVGTCWAFSTVETIESAWALAGHNLTALSVEQVVDCSSNTDVSTGNANCGVFGGWPYLAYQYIIKHGGLESAAVYPYCTGDGQCFPCAPPGYNKTLCGAYTEYCDHSNKCTLKNIVAKITDWSTISTNEDQIATQLVSRGPLSALLDASWLQFYKGGVWKPNGLCSKTSLDHAVQLTGFGATSEGEKYWVVRNSWNKTWGMDGYFYIARGYGECGINTAVTVPIV